MSTLSISARRRGIVAAVLAATVAVTGIVVAGPAQSASAASGTSSTISATTTGVPQGTKLKVHNGDLVIKTAGTVIDGLDIRGFVRVEAQNVTIKNSIVRGRQTSGNATMIYAGTGKSAGLVVRNTEIAPTYKTPLTNGVYGWDFTLDRVNIHDVIDSVHIFGNNVTVANSWLHNNLHFTNDPYHEDGSHDDNIQIQKGSNIVIANNKIDGSYNAALMITQDQGAVSNVRLSNNWIAGGGCTVNIAEKGKGAIMGVKITDNVFGGSRFGCSVIHPPTTDVYQKGNTKADGSIVRIDRRAQ
ncbi:hypothetical protein OH146_06690 [Salinibacterium sp. SYSU T00001]|uniref:hypothetical protein n=1 Tax=Homoserinimonas sedimenticola TaxID=2986805 RepID=UPI002235FCC2|nr:hypothetical protein [Salinibacterium sedimenticola]MCW4385456.1 hypothetical protein [Salinibacterium sedimenticola]